MVFTTDGFFEVLMENWPEWDLNPRPLNSVQMFQLTELSGHEITLHSETSLYSYSNFIFVHCSDFILAISFGSRHIYFNENFAQVIT